jgi:hypothetical protein
VDVSNATITCTGVTGTVKFAPHLVIGGTSTSENSNVKLVLSNCTVGGLPGPVTITSGKGAGVLHSNTNDASSVFGPNPVSGHVNIKWASTSKLTFKMSTVLVTLVNGGTDGIYASLAVTPGNASVSGDFTGGDNGAASAFYAETTQTIATLTTEATPPSAIKLVNLGTDATHLMGNSLQLG